MSEAVNVCARVGCLSATLGTWCSRRCRRLAAGGKHMRPNSGEEVVNDRPCASCGEVYPFSGTRREVAATLRGTEGRCPFCYVGRPLRDKGRSPTPIALMGLGMTSKRRRGRATQVGS